ncbi:MAG: hypothetical protein WCG75_00170 [Armatimonadota bacterium]
MSSKILTDAIQRSIQTGEITRLTVRTHEEAKALMSEAFALSNDEVEVNGSSIDNLYDLCGFRIVKSVPEMVWLIEITVQE